MSFDTIRGLAEIFGVLAFLVITVWREQKALDTHTGVINHQQMVINALVDALKQADNTPATLAAIKGATDNVPPEFFNKMITVLATSKLFVPEELKGLVDVLAKFFKDVEPTITPPPDGVTDGSTPGQTS